MSNLNNDVWTNIPAIDTTADNDSSGQHIDSKPEPISGNTYKFHQLSSIFPEMSEDEFQKLKESIKVNGLREPIWLYEDQIIDGRNRCRACQELDTKPEFRTYKGDGSLISFVIDLNLNRRHLTGGQKACIAAEALPLLEQEAKERQKATQIKDGKPPTVGEKIPTPDKGRARERAAKLAQTNDRYVSDAKKIQTKAPELFQEIKAGTLTIPAALNKISRHVINNRGDNEWQRLTPSFIAEAVRKVFDTIDVDPASSATANETVKAVNYYTIEDDGLKQDWSGKVFLNPPNNLVSQFCESLVQKFHNKEVKEAIVLVNNATETAWFQTMLGECSAVCFPKGRIKFLNEQGEPLEAPLQGQAILYFGANTKLFSDVFGSFGKVLWCCAEK